MAGTIPDRTNRRRQMAHAVSVSRCLPLQTIGSAALFRTFVLMPALYSIQ